jgi:hypothetical protein
MAAAMNTDLVVVPPAEVARLDDSNTPEALIAFASRLATVLADVVKRQHLYQTIGGRMYPTVEAWSTIARMDGVVAREASTPVRRDDGSYEAWVELVRLRDGFIVGGGSAICGMPDDRPWAQRSEFNRRSMAVTRATSRAMRQQYSWIMALAGYEPTPAEEMLAHPQAADVEAAYVPSDDKPTSIRGRLDLGDTADGQVRQTPDGVALSFRVFDTPARKVQVIARDGLAMVLEPLLPGLVNKTVTVQGRLEMVEWQQKGEAMKPYRRIHLARLLADDFTVPADETAE